MNWDAIGAIGQVLGSLAVFVTLGYLAVQIRHAQEQAQRALSQSRSETFREFVAFGASERISRILTKAQDALGVPPSPNFAEFTKTMEGIGLAREEAFALAGYQMIGWNYRMQLIPYADELPAIERTAFDVATRAFYGTPGVGRIFYDTFVKPKAHPDGVRYVENLLAQPG